MYTALVDAFAIPGVLNTTSITATLDAYKTKFKDPGLLGNFLENQDLPRWANISVDPQSMYNAMVFNFMSDGYVLFPFNRLIGDRLKIARQYPYSVLWSRTRIPWQCGSLEP